MHSKSLGFVALKSLTQGAPDPKEALADIRRIYFKTTKGTIQDDFAHAIELLKCLPTEDERQKAHVYMEGLAQMRDEWGRKGEEGQGGKAKGGKGKGGKGTASLKSKIKDT